MRPAVLIGVLLIVLGVLSLAYQGLTYTKREKVLDLGPIHATTEKKETIPLPPILGVVALGAGVVLVLAGNKS
jgi:uncharacterized membrane protein YidH (DUF202 family)